MLYKVLWKGFPPEIATWEEEDGIHDDFIDAFEDGLDEEEEEDDDDAEEGDEEEEEAEEMDSSAA